MSRSNQKAAINRRSLPKARTGISGLDNILGGGLPRGRPTLVVGSAGAGKTLMATEFIVRGATEYGEPGVFLAFEETADELVQNVRSMGFDLKRLMAKKLVSIDHVRVERSEIEETGEYDLEGLFVRLGYAIDSIHAKRVVIDTIEVLFGGLQNELVLRSEMRRLFRWLKTKGVTTVITAEQGNGTFTRHGLEEYVSDAVICLDHRVVNQLSTRRLRVVKYRGSSHGTNEYPFLINEEGFQVLPITSLGLRHTVSTQHISSGAKELDAMLGGKGFYRGSTILVSGTAGSGKTSLASHLVDAACRRGERCLYFAFEESERQIIRNMRSIGIDLEPWVKKSLLHFAPARPTLYGLETHLAKMHEAVRRTNPSVVIVDPITDMMGLGTNIEVKAMLMRLVDFLKAGGITAFLTSLTTGGHDMEQTEVGISSLIDTWILVRDMETNGERTRGVYILKARGMAHSNQIREFLLTSHGVRLLDVFVGPHGVLTGSARVAQQAQEVADAAERARGMEHKALELERKRQAILAQIEALEAELSANDTEYRQTAAQEKVRFSSDAESRTAMARQRQAGKNGSEPTRGNDHETRKR